MKNRVALLFILLVAAFASADTPPPVNGFRLKYGTSTGILKLSNGVASNLAGSSSGDVLTWSGSAWGAQAPAASGANTTLSNLGSTAINAGLVPSPTAGFLDLGSTFYRWNLFAQDVNVAGTLSLVDLSANDITAQRFFGASAGTIFGSPTPSTGIDSNGIYFRTGNSDFNTTGTIGIYTGDGTGASTATGGIDIAPGYVNGSAQAGWLTMSGGYTATGTPGGVSIVGGTNDNEDVGADVTISGGLPTNSVKIGSILDLQSHPIINASSLSVTGAGSTANPGTALLTLNNTHGFSQDQFGLSFTNTGFAGVSSISSYLDIGGATSGLVFYTGTAASDPSMIIDGLTQNLSLRSHRITELLNPVGDQDAATKAYADTKIASIGVTAPIASTGGTSPTISCIAATGSVAGCLSAADWTTFNGKQAAGNYITALTGDVTASGPGSVAATLKNTGTAGTYTKVTTDAQGRVSSGTTLASGDIPNNAANTSGTAAGLSATLAAGSGGTGQTSIAAAFVSFYESVATTLGDLVYGGASGAPTRLAGDTSNTRKFLRSVSSGGVAAAPAWDTILAADVPTLNQNTTGTATNATNVATTATNSTNASFFPAFVSSSSSGNQGVDTATGLTFNPSTNTLTTTTFVGALTGAASSNVLKVGDTMTGQLINNTNGAASTPPLLLSGTWFTGGSATTTKSGLLIEPAGTTTTGWSTSGTGLGINGPSGFSGLLADFQLNGASKVNIDGGSTTKLTVKSGSETVALTNDGTTICLDNTSHASSCFIRMRPNTGFVSFGVGTNTNSWAVANNSNGTGTNPGSDFNPNGTGAAGPVWVSHNSNTTPGNYGGCASTAAGSDKLTAGLFQFNDTHTTNSEAGHTEIWHSIAGTKTKIMTWLNKGQVEYSGSAVTATCNGNTATIESGSVAGMGRLTAPSSPGTSCIVTVPAFTNKAHCDAVNETPAGGRLVPMVCSSTTSCTITDASLSASDVLSFHCSGHS